MMISSARLTPADHLLARNPSGELWHWTLCQAVSTKTLSLQYLEPPVLRDQSYQHHLTPTFVWEVVRRGSVTLAVSWWREVSVSSIMPTILLALPCREVSQKLEFLKLLLSLKIIMKMCFLIVAGKFLIFQKYLFYFFMLFPGHIACHPRLENLETIPTSDL